MSRSLKIIGNMKIGFHQKPNTFNPKRIIKTMSNELTENAPVFSSLISSIIESNVTIKDKKKDIFRGNIISKFSVVPELDYGNNSLLKCPSSRCSVVQMEDIGELPPTQKEITLYKRTHCGFCHKQDSILNNFRNTNSENSKRLDKFVDIKTVEKLSDIINSDVREFPSWVIRKRVEPGIKSSFEINKLLDRVETGIKSSTEIEMMLNEIRKEQGYDLDE